MAASCMTKIFKAAKGLVCRNSDGDDPVKIASSNAINRLFDILNVKKNSKAYGWSILKFSGDSSHIVFGQIMEKIKKWDSTKNKYLSSTFKIIYAVSERPLAARLLAASKTVYLSMTDVFMNNFDGKGSENKNDTHAALYIEFDKSHAYTVSIDGLFEKVKLAFNQANDYKNSRAFLNFVTQLGGVGEETNKQRQERNARLNERNKKKEERDKETKEQDNMAAAEAETVAASEAERLAASEAETVAADETTKFNTANLSTVEKLNAINTLLNNPLPIDSPDTEQYDEFQTQIKNNTQIQDFLKTFEIETLVLNINNVITDEIKDKDYFNELAANMISQRWLLGFRSKRETNWNHVMMSLYSNKPEDGEKFRNMQKIINMLTDYYVNNVDKTEDGKIQKDTDLKLFKDVYINKSSFETIFNKIITANENENKRYQFKENRIADWSKTGNSGENIPPQIITIIGELDSFVQNCFKLKNVMPTTITALMVGGEITPNDQDKQDKKYLAKESAEQTEQDIVQVLSEIPYFNDKPDNEYLYLITDLIALINESINYNFYTKSSVVEHIKTEYPNILAARLKTLCGIIQIPSDINKEFEDEIDEEKQYLDDALKYIFKEINDTTDTTDTSSIFDNQFTNVIKKLREYK